MNGLMLYFDLILLQQAPAGNPLLGFLPLLLIIAIFYFLVFMPMQRQRKKTAEMLRELKTGDVVVTSGGIVGTVFSITDDKLVLKVRPGDIKLEFLRSAVASKVDEKKEVTKA